ncbi:MAG TPA: hypothetical protein VN345_16315 [Blastocatellia bacterium]|jgi:hypothetical protein|nr:hypothetical protein [Blastocatellia bacterium]
MRASALSIAVVLAMNFLTFAIAASQEPPEAFTVCVKAEDVQRVEEGIRFTVEVTNNTEGDVELSVREGEPPYSIFVSSEDGKTLDSVEFRRGLEKNRHQKNVPVLFRAHEKKTYEGTFSGYVDDGGKERSIPAGLYTFYALVPILSYAQQMQPHSYLMTRLAKSNLITVTLK